MNALTQPSCGNLIELLRSLPEMREAERRSREPEARIQVIEPLRAPLIAALAQAQAERRGRAQVLVVTATSRESEGLGTALGALCTGAEIVHLPAWETLPHERLSPSPGVIGERLQAFRAMREFASAGGASDGAPDVAEGSAASIQIILASVRAALQPVADNLGEGTVLTLAVGDRIDQTELIQNLIRLAYVRVDLVTRRGEFAVRGGIIDVFPPTADFPYRLDFFGDELDVIRQFHVADQRTADQANGTEIRSVQMDASREILLTDEVQRRARHMQLEFPGLAGMLEKIGQGIPVDGMESLAPAFIDSLVPITHYLGDKAAVAVLGRDRVEARAASLAETNREFMEAAWLATAAGADHPIDVGRSDYLAVDDLRGSGRAWWEITPFDDGTDATAHVTARAIPNFRGNADGATDHIAQRLAEHWSVAITTAGKGTAERAVQLLSDKGLAASSDETLDALPDPGVVHIVGAELDGGFEIDELKLAVITESEYFGRATTYQASGKKLATRRRNAVDPLQLKPGDLVVHEQHGIGRFAELTQRTSTAGGVEHVRDFIVIEYAPMKKGFPPDQLLVPADKLDRVTRYVGGENPSLSKMGGSDWSRTKGQARKAVREIAVELVKLYSARVASKGHAFGPDTPWQHEMEEAFPYAETPDQLQVIDEVKADMESDRPMDRLLSGDVGFGKTEVAVRAAFKAVQDGMQVAILAPTTLLVQQHYETFKERFAGFPLNVRALSRFQSAKDAKETIAGLADGTVDVVIGTHRLLSKDVVYKSLGLVIIDEEQRFGVEHKERLKTIKANVDVLAMSATPIPRTLEMAVTGIREMSTLATPPEQRHPILTYVGPYVDKQVAAAIRRELLREGQVFYVHNRVSSIQAVAAHIAELVPEARIAVAHGQMSEAALEQVIIDFWERRFDVLVSTTIIETGMDIPNANTLIMDRADKFGLAQLHQLRGRVGRGRERGYAYFLYDADRPLSEIAADRLETIAANNELGAGMQVAMKDLELRGAGNILGGEQSGHIAGVGFDLYLRMIGDAVATFKGENTEEAVEMRLELPVDAHIPEYYVDSERLRLEAYQKLATASSPQGKDGAIDAVLDELTDRYGVPPEPVQNLIAVARLRKELQGSGLAEVVVANDRFRVSPLELPESVRMRLRRMYPESKYLEGSGGGTVIIPVPESAYAESDPLAVVTWARNALVALSVLPAPAATAGTPATHDTK